MMRRYTVLVLHLTGIALVIVSGCDGSKSANRSAAYFDSGVAKQGRGDLDGAIGDYTKVIELDPEHVAAFANRGQARSEKGDWAGAIADCTRAIQLAPTAALAYNNRGLAKNNKGDFEGAIADCTLAITLDPRLSLAYNNRGLAKDSTGDFDGAIADCTRAITLDPRLSAAYNNRGLAKSNKGDFDGGIADFAQAITLDRKNPRFYHNRGNANLFKGIFDGAIADYTRAIELDPKYADPYNNRGVAKGRKGDLDGAIEDLTKVLELQPNNADAYTSRSIIRKAKGDAVGALADRRHAAIAFQVLCFAKYGEGDMDGAFADLKRALEVDPEGDPNSALDIPPKPSSSQKEAKLPEFKLLELWAGDWTLEMTVEGPGQTDPMKSRSERKCDLLVQGRFLRTRDSITDAQTGEESQLTQMLTYDPKRKTFRHWLLPEDPNTLGSTGAWVESRSSFTLNVQFKGGLRLNHEGIMQDADSYVFTTKMTDSQGKIMWTAEGRMVRVK